MIIPTFIQQREDYRSCIAFHGHTCMGVTIGYLAARFGVEWFNNTRNPEDELITIVENTGCCCDAIQVLTGCTFGKGNFFFKDYGKMAFTFATSKSRQAIRIVLTQDLFTAPGEERQLAELIRQGRANQLQKRQYEKLLETRSEELFRQGPRAFFDIRDVTIEIPARPGKSPSLRCDGCGEFAHSTKCHEVKGKHYCRACLQ